MLVALCGQSLRALVVGHRDDLRHLGLCNYLIAVLYICNILSSLVQYNRMMCSLLHEL